MGVLGALQVELLPSPPASPSEWEPAINDYSIHVVIRVSYVSGIRGANMWLPGDLSGNVGSSIVTSILKTFGRPINPFIRRKKTSNN